MPLVLVLGGPSHGRDLPPDQSQRPCPAQAAVRTASRGYEERKIGSSLNWTVIEIMTKITESDKVNLMRPN